MTDNQECKLCAGSGEIETQNSLLQEVTVGCPECMEREWQSQEAQGAAVHLETLAKIAESEDISVEVTHDDYDGSPTRFEQDISEHVAKWIRGMVPIFGTLRSGAPAAVPEGVIEFVYLHPRSGEKRSVIITRKHIVDNAPDLLDDLLAEQVCHCEPVGETNVVECNCEDYIEDFELQEAAEVIAAPAPAGADNDEHT